MQVMKVEVILLILLKLKLKFQPSKWVFLILRESLYLKLMNIGLFRFFPILPEGCGFVLVDFQSRNFVEKAEELNNSLNISLCSRVYFFVASCFHKGACTTIGMKIC